MTLTLTRTLAAALLGTATVLLAATSATVDPKASRITATFTQMGVSVDSTFKTFSGQIHYDPAAPEASSAALSIDTASWDIGDEDYNAEVRKPEWFDSQRHPQARFESTTIRALGQDRFEATGTLTLKGKSQPVTTQVSVKTQDGTHRFSGTLPLSRKAFGIGDPEWDEVLADGVQVKFLIVSPAS